MIFLFFCIQFISVRTNIVFHHHYSTIHFIFRFSGQSQQGMMGPNGPGGPSGPSGPTGPNGPGGQQMGVGYGGGASSGGPGFNNPTGQYATQPPYHSPQMQNTPGNMGVPQRFPSGPGQGGPGAPQGRSIGNPKQALQDMIRARNDPQFSSAGGKYLILIIQC